MTSYSLPPRDLPVPPEPEAKAILPGEQWTHPALETLPPNDWAHAYFQAYLSPIGLGTLSKSWRHAGITRDQYRARRDNDTIFRIIHDAADDELREAFEYVLNDRVLHGTNRPVYQRGVLVGYVREIDNRLLQWFLERAIPEKYHLATKFEMSGDNAPGAFKFQMGEVGDPVEPKELGSGDDNSD